MTRPTVRTSIATGVALAGIVASAGAASAAHPRFSDFTPLPASAGPTADEAAPITFGNPAFRQESIASRNEQVAAGEPNSGAWDMLTVNESGRHQGRYLFSPFESGQSGIQRTDLRTGETETVWYSPAAGAHVSFDASYWTPGGSYVTAEESWCSAPAGCTTSSYGRLFELTNPLTAGAVTDAAGEDGVLVHRNVIPRVSHEGVQFDKRDNMYFIDELNGGSLYKYVPSKRWCDDHGHHDKRRGRGHRDGHGGHGKPGYFDAGQTFVLRVGDGNTPNATGAYTWVPITDAKGKALPGALTITDPSGVTSVDGRNTTDLPAFKGTDYQRPEDLQLQTVRGRQRLYVATTTTNEVYVLDLSAGTISVFASTASTDLATGSAVGAGLTNPDNLAIDSEGNIYVVEDRNGAVDDDIWFARDLNHDGDLADAGEGLGRWASNGTAGSEFTGLYFDPFDKGRAWVNIQHPASGNDRTMEITTP